MTLGLDTSVVLRLLMGEPKAQAQRALAEFESHAARGDRILISDLVVAEVYFALQHHYGVPKAEAITLLDQFLSDTRVTTSGAAGATLRMPGLSTAKPGFVDRLIHAEYAAAGGHMLTFERAAAHLPATRVLLDES